MSWAVLLEPAGCLLRAFVYPGGGTVKLSMSDLPLETDGDSWLSESGAQVDSGVSLPWELLLQLDSTS